MYIYQLLSEEDYSDSLLESESLSLDSDLYITKKKNKLSYLTSEHSEITQIMYIKI